MLLATLAGCGDGGGSGSAPADEARAAAARPPALCAAPPRMQVTGRVANPGAVELSGLVVSRSRRGVLWALNDSGNRPSLFAFASTGRSIAEVTVAGAQNTDWEDIANGRTGALLVGDIGDNLGERPSITVLKVPEPAAAAGGGTGAVDIAPTARYELRYADGPRDAETLLFDPTNGSIVIVAKSFGPPGGIYAARRPSSRTVTTLRRTGTLKLDDGEAVTAGDVSADGRTIVLRTYDRAFAWRRRPGETVDAALRRRPCMIDVNLLAEIQGEALALTPDGRAFLTVPEGRRPALRRYESSANGS